MKASNIKVKLENLVTHQGDFSDSSFKMKCDASYEDLMLVLEGDKRRVRLHARNINNAHLEKDALRISGMNFEVTEDDKPSVVSGAVRLELGDEAEKWYEEIW